MQVVFSFTVRISCKNEQVSLLQYYLVKTYLGLQSAKATFIRKQCYFNPYCGNIACFEDKQKNIASKKIFYSECLSL